jgi:nicotine oxidoreductase
VTVSSQMIRTLSSKAGQPTIRGSGDNIVSAEPKDINIKAIANLKNLVIAYESIKSKPGNMTEGTSPETLDGISLEQLKAIQKDLRSGSFSFPPARRIQIPKPGKKETRPLTIASPRDKIVQKAIQLVMEPVFEKTFLDCSHGFRPKKGTKTAIQYVDAKFQSSHYIIEADFTKAFDSISHDKLMSYLKETITCEKILRLIKSGLKAGYVELGNLHENLSEGTPQGSILSPLLCNIFLHKLDLFMEDIKNLFNVGLRKQKSKEYMSLVNKCKYMRKKGTDKTNPILYRELQKKMLSIPSVTNNESYVRANYVRYADDFIIGVEGSYQTAVAILGKVQNFINYQLGLKLNPDKTGITKYSVKPVKFLGYIIMAPHLKGIEKPLEALKISDKISEVNDTKLIARRKKIRIRFHMDYEKVLKRLEANHFIRKRVSHTAHNKLMYRGTFRGNLINLDHADIIRYYNSVMRGIYNYYDFTLNISNLANVM